MDSPTQTYDDGQISEAAFTDFSKALGGVHHALLLYRLKAYGFIGKFLTFLENFLSERLFSNEVHRTFLFISSALRHPPGLCSRFHFLVLFYANDLSEVLIVLKLM